MRTNKSYFSRIHLYSPSPDLLRRFARSNEQINNITPQTHADAYVSRITCHDNATVQGNVWLEHLRTCPPQTLSVAVELWAAWSVELHGHLHPRARPWATQPQRLSALTLDESLSHQPGIETLTILKRPPQSLTTQHPAQTLPPPTYILRDTATATHIHAHRRAVGVCAP